MKGVPRHSKPYMKHVQDERSPVILLQSPRCAVIDYCTARNIKADIALIRPDEISRAYERVVNKDVRSRLVIDMASMKSVAGSKR